MYLLWSRANSGLQADDRRPQWRARGSYAAPRRDNLGEATGPRPRPPASSVWRSQLNPWSV